MENLKIKNPFSTGSERVSEMCRMKPALATFLTRLQAELQIGARQATRPVEAVNLRAKRLIVKPQSPENKDLA